MSSDGSSKVSGCVVGACIAGLVTAKVLEDDGFDVTVFEKQPGIGGVWEASRSYPGLRTNSPREAYELDTGERIAADVVVFATGWRQSVSFLDDDLRHLVEDGSFHLYRHVLPPGEPRLGFVGYASSIVSTLTSEIPAHWLSQCSRGELALPDREEMETEIESVREWAEEAFGPARQGYFIGPHVSHYVDDLMRDVG